jgi:hypothetical protein
MGRVADCTIASHKCGIVRQAAYHRGQSPLKKTPLEVRVRRAIVLLFACLVGSPGMACLQTYGTNLHGRQITFEGLTGRDLVETVTRHEPRAYWLAEAQRLKAKAADPRDFKNQNDYAVTLIHLGEVARAMALLRIVEAQHPGRSQTAANLGTGFDLLGHNLEALQWIREGIRRDQQEHFGTEWLHVRILEAKIAAAANPRFLRTHSVAGLDFGTAEEPRLLRPYPPDNTGRPVSIKELGTALGYQIGERLEFERPPDPIMGDLLFDWGNLLAVTEVLESADAAYSEAERFGPPRRSLFLERQQAMKAILRKASAKPTG